MPLVPQTGGLPQLGGVALSNPPNVADTAHVEEASRSPRRDRVPLAIAGLVALAALVAVGSAAAFGEPALPLASEPRGPGFDFLRTAPRGTPISFDPCSPIHYVVNPDLAPPGAYAEVFRAVHALEEGSGLNLEFDGITDEPAGVRRPLFQPRRYGDGWAPVLIGWVPSSEIRRGHAFGLARPLAVQRPGGHPVFVSGTVLLNADAGLMWGLSWERLVLHELGHVVGLGHVDDPSQVMYPELLPGGGILGDGDLAGLKAISFPCRRVPEPGGG